jgi:hypothetical protein
VSDTVSSMAVIFTSGNVIVLHRAKDLRVRQIFCPFKGLRLIKCKNLPKKYAQWRKIFLEAPIGPGLASYQD